MKRLKTFEEYVGVEFVAPKNEHPSYKNEEKKKKKKKNGSKLGEMEPVMTPPNHVKDVISFKREG